MSILGVSLCPLTRAQLLDRIAAAASGRRAWFGYANAHALNLACAQPRLRRALNAADYVVCDGFGVKWAAQILGRPLPERMTPPDWLPDVLALAARSGYSVYFLGNRPGVAATAAARLRVQFQGLQVAGVQDGYFDKTAGSAENERVLAAINAARPDILYVGFGMPVQEYWLEENWPRLQVNAAIAVGAMLDYVTGVTPRGPRWATDHGWEWLTRLLIEPRRLWRRYLIGNPLFVFRVLRQRFGRTSPEVV